MRFQTFAVIFIAIILPISMVLSYYIQMQSDTIALESQYQSRLNNATYAAVSAYQMNSLNTQRVAGESIYSYVDASINTFHTTLATSMMQSNASRSAFRNYIPAILFTTYDGYYIYSPYKAAVAAINEEDGQNVLTVEEKVVYMKKNTSANYKISDERAKDIKEKSESTLDPEFTTDIDNARYDYSYKLKPFIYYSARYKDNNHDIVASYSLDNFISVSGMANGKAFSKAGYGISPGDVTIKGNFLIQTAQRIEVTDTATGTNKETTSYPYNEEFLRDGDGNLNDTGFEYYYDNVNRGSLPGARYKMLEFDTANLTSISSQEVKKMIFDYQVNAKKDSPAGNGFYYSQVNTSADAAASGDTLLTRYQTGEQIINDTVYIHKKIQDMGSSWDSKKISTTGTTDVGGLTVTYKGQAITDPDAMRYYIKAYFFSTWVNENLGDITEDRIIENEQITIEKEHDYRGFYDYFYKEGEAHGNGAKIFLFNSANDPASDLSPFSVHKTSVIKNSIQTNLNAAISNFNEDRQIDNDDDYRYAMPVLTGADWDNILNNVCMVAFMQGLPTGNNRSFNNYAIVKSSNNNTYVTPDSLYFTLEIGNGETPSTEYYHKLDCPKLGETKSDQELMYDRSAEFKYDAKRMNSLVLVNDDGSLGSDIIAFEDESTNTFYQKVTLGDGTISVGPPIDNPDNFTPDGSSEEINLHDPADAVMGDEMRYLYDHKNYGCYDCIISGNFDSMVKYYDNDLYYTGILSTGEIKINYNKNGSENWINLDGTKYTGDETPVLIAPKYYSNYAQVFEIRRRALFNALGKFKEKQYKNNGYINL